MQLTSRATDEDHTGRMTSKNENGDGSVDGLGAVVHGPVVLARAPGIAVGLRCVFGYPSGLMLPLVLRARGVQGEAARRVSLDPSPGPRYQDHGESDPWSGPQLSVEVEGRTRRIHPTQEESSGGDDTFDLEATYWVDQLPRNGRLGLQIAWARAGLPLSTVTITLEDLTGLDERLLPLP